MGTYYIPRNYKGETRILYIFSIKSLITTALGAIFGLIFFFPLQLMGFDKAKWVALGIFAVIGWCIGALKIPTISNIPVTKKIGGEPLSEIIIRYFKFRKNKRVYTYFNTKADDKIETKEEK